MADYLKLKGPVREIGIIRDHDRHDSFNITIGITIKTEGKVSYEEAERLSTKFRREYLGKDVEFRAIHLPCPYCEKILNSESGVKQHILKIHPEKAELINPPKASTKIEKLEKKTRGKTEKVKKKENVKAKEKPLKPVKTTKSGKTTNAKSLKTNTKKDTKSQKTRPTLKADIPEPARSKVKVEPYKHEPRFEAPAKRKPKSTKAKQLTLA